jgi:gamma-glutamyltranspeptidase/glutathione hydrolase
MNVHSPSSSRLGGVIACIESLAAEAGAEILRLGGNAADAAVATAFAQGVVNPIHCGIGGGFHGLFFEAVSGRTSVVASDGRAPRAAHAQIWADKLAGRWGAVWKVAGDRNRLGYEASMVPGFVRGAHAALSHFGSGRVSWRQVIEPAIRLAEEGFVVYPYLYRLWMPNGFLEFGDGPRVLGFTAASREIYLRDGRVYEIGERLVQRDYARTLERIADQGPDEFYEGETGQRIAADFAANGGMLSAEDLREYRADVVEPISTTFREYQVVTESAPSVGPVTLEVLNILEGWDLASLGWNTPAYLDRLARAMHLGFRDRMAWIADPVVVDVPLDRLISKRYAAELRALIEQGEDVRPSPPRRAMPEETTHLSVMDNAGNAAGITHSTGVSSGVVTPGLGFQHNCHMLMFDPEPGRRNSIAPWKRPITGGGPALFLRDGQVYLLIGSPAGARKVTALIQATLNVLDFGMSIQQAVSVDRIHVEDEPATIIVEPFFPPETLLGLAERGHHIRFESYTARLAAVLRDPETGKLEGGTDPRGDRGLAVV